MVEWHAGLEIFALRASELFEFACTESRLGRHKPRMWPQLRSFPLASKTHLNPFDSVDLMVASGFGSNIGQSSNKHCGAMKLHQFP